MVFLLILIKIFAFSEQIEYKIMIDIIFKKTITRDISFEYCIQKKTEKNFHFRGRPQKMSKILKNEKPNKNLMIKNNIKYKKYKSVFIKDQSELDYIYLFPNSTIFLVNGNNNFSNKDEDLFDPNYCFFKDYSFEFDNLTYFYIIINKKIGDKFSSFIIQSLLIILFVFDFCFLCTFLAKVSCIDLFIPLYIFKFTSSSLFFSLAIIFSCFLFFFFTYYLSSLIYSMYKSYMILHLILFLNDLSIIYNNYPSKLKCKYGFFIFLFESISTLIFTYIIYFIPSLDNFYLFFTRNILEYFLLIIYMITIKENLYRLYQQYKFERRLRSLLAISYKIKFIIYLKVFIFSFLYYFIFIILHIILIASKINYYTDGFLYYYSINISIEILFVIILTIIFYNIEVSNSYYYPIIFGYDSIKCAEIKNKKESNISISTLILRC